MKATFLTCALAAVLLSSCSSDPATPVDEREHDHDEPAKAVLTLAAGHFHGVRFHQDAPCEGEKYMKAVQTITFVNVEGKGWTIPDSSAQAFYVMAGDSDTESPYGLWITYLAADGDTITKTFIEGGQDKIHQHFFSATGVKPYGDGTAQEGDDLTPNVFAYKYMDTTPWDKTLNDAGTTLNGADNPIGFKGWFNFLRPRKQMTLLIELMHARLTKLTNGIASPYYAPTTAQRQSEEFDVVMKVPVYVLHSRSEETNWDADEDATYDDLNAADKKIVDALSAAYGISHEEALAAMQLRVYGKRDTESGSLWF